MNIYGLYRKTGKSGSVKWIIVFIIGLIIASYFFDFSVQDAIEDEQTQLNFGYIKDNAVYFYDTYIRQYAEPFFVFLKNTFIKIISGDSSGIENLAPAVTYE